MKKRVPMMTAIEAIIVMKRSNSYRRGDSPAPADEARLAICPMTVLSPVKITTPTPLPWIYYLISLPLCIMYQRKLSFWFQEDFRV